MAEHTMDIVYLNNLEVDAVIGIYAWERRIRQPLLLYLELGCDIRPAAASDRIEQALDYKTIAKRVMSYVSASEFQLVETLAENVANLLQTEFQVPWLRLRINKRGAVRGVRDVGIIIERGQR